MESSATAIETKGIKGESYFHHETAGSFDALKRLLEDVETKILQGPRYQIPIIGGVESEPLTETITKQQRKKGDLERERQTSTRQKSAWLIQQEEYWRMNQAAYDALDPDLLEQHHGEYTVFYRGRFLGFGSDMIDLGRRVVREHGVGTDGMGFIEVGEEEYDGPFRPTRGPRTVHLD